MLLKADPRIGFFPITLWSIGWKVRAVFAQADAQNKEIERRIDSMKVSGALNLY
jgi:hypothetical protein